MSEPSARFRGVVDTNLFVSGTLFQRGNPYALLEAWRARRFVLLLSERQHDELTAAFRRPRIAVRYSLPPADLIELFARLADAPRAPLSPTVPLPVSDVKDEHLLAAAFGGDVDYLISGDKDLLVLAGDPRLGKLKIVTAAEFLVILDRLAPDGETEG